jgi:hypothetical protein
MKKMQSALRQKPHRLSLNRETIRHLEDPALLRFAKGGADDTAQSPPTQESTSGVPELFATWP